MAREFQRGHKAKVSDLTAGTDLYVGVQIAGSGLSFDVSCFGLDAEQQLSDDRYFIFFNQPKSPEESVQLLGAQAGDTEAFRVTLDRVPSQIKRLSFTATIDGAGQMSQVGPGYVRIVAGGEEVARYAFTGAEFSTERAVMLGDFYFKDVWRFEAVGQGFDGGLDALLKNFGGEVLEEEEPAAAQPAAAPGFAPPGGGAPGFAPPGGGAPAPGFASPTGVQPSAPQPPTPQPAPSFGAPAAPAPAAPPMHGAATVAAPMPPGTVPPPAPPGPGQIPGQQPPPFGGQPAVPGQPQPGPPGMQPPPGMPPPGMQPPGTQPPGMQPPGMHPPGMQPPGMMPPGGPAPQIPQAPAAGLASALDSFRELANGQRWSLQNAQLVRADLGVHDQQPVLARQGSMVLYQGKVEFSHKGAGFRGRITGNATGQEMQLMRCAGRGQVFFAEESAYLHPIELQGDAICVSAENVLAFDESLQHEVRRIEGHGIPGGALFTLVFQGTGTVVVTTRGTPVVLPVTPTTFADSNAIVAWSAASQVIVSSQVRLRRQSYPGHSGEAVNLQFRGAPGNFIVVQPHEV